MDAVDPYIAAGATQTPTPPQPGEVDPFISAGATEADPYKDAGATEADPYKDAGATAVPPLSEQDFQDKLKTRWGPMLMGQSMAAPADIIQMQASGRFTPEQIQQIQTETDLRQADIQEQAKTGGHPWLLHPLDSLGTAVKGAIPAAWNMVKDLPSLGKIFLGHGDPNSPNYDPVEAAKEGQGVLQGGYDAVSGIGKLATGLVTGPVSAAGEAWGIGQPATPEQAYQARKLEYLKTHATPGYVQPDTNSAVQNAESAWTGDPGAAVGIPGAKWGIPAENWPVPDPGLASAVSTAVTLPAYGAASKLVGGVIPKALSATGLDKAAPTLSKLVSPSGEGVANARKLEDAANAAMEGATPRSGNAALVANIAAKIGNAVSAGGRSASAIGAIPSNFTRWVAEKLSGSPDLADKVVNSGILGKATMAAIPVVGLGPVASAIGVVKGLEAVGAIGEGLGDFMTRVATADPTNPYGRFMALAADKLLPKDSQWMRQVSQSPAVQAVLKAGTVAGGVAKGAVKGGATGLGLSLVSGDSPEEASGNIGSMGAFGALNGGMTARDSKIFQAHLGAVTKFISGHLDAGGSPDTLRLVPADQILQAALLKNLLPDVQVRFATAQDAGSPFAKGGTAENQAGLYDSQNSQNKTIWIDPTKRAPGATLLHEAFHPIFDNLVSQQGGIKDSLDQALAADGRSIDDFKKQYADAAFPGNPQAAADYITAQDRDNPNWAYSELLSESAAHQLSGQDLLEAANGKAVAQSATQAALGGLDGWLSAQGVEWKKTLSGVVFPDFQNVFNSPETRRLAYKLAQAQRQTVLGKAQPESTGRGLTAADMGKAPAPYYQGPNKENFNAYGREITDPTGKTTFKPWPASELRKRAKAEAIARQKYFPVGQKITSMPAGLEADPDIAPWTKKALKEIFDSSQSKSKLSMWYHRLNNENSATSDRGWAADVRRSLGNVQVSYQSGKPVSVEMTKKGNLITHWESEEAENQKLSDWANRHGDLSLDLWGGDQAKAKADIQTYLENHATGQPGESNGIGTAKRDVINAMLAGGNKEFEDKNPLRAKLKDRDRAGIMRSLRVDRMESATPEPSDRAPSDWEKLKRNLSPGEPLQFSPKAKEDYKLDKAYDYWLDKEGKLHAAPEGHAEWAVKNIQGLKEKLSDTGNPDADALVNMRSIYGHMFKAGNLRLTREEGRVNVDFRNITPTKAQKAALENVSLHRGEPVVDDNGETYVDFSGQLQFSPSEGPKAIASAAVRDEDTGKIYPGSDHDSAARKAPTGRASNLIDGYVTNDGEFLDRDTAFKRAVAQKQYKPSDEDYNVNKILYGLTSERFNKQNPNTYAGVQRAKAVLEAQKSAGKKRHTYSPTPRESLTSAAIRVDKEHIFTSDSHFGAFTKALKSGLVTEDDAWGPRQEDGFMTTAGRFVPRQEGYKIAAEAQQVQDPDPHLTQNGTWLDSSNTKFTPQAGGRAGRYSPTEEKNLTFSKPGVKSGSMEDEKLSYPMEMAPGKAGGRLPGILTAPYSQKLLYQRQMLKAMAPLFEAFGVKPGTTVKSSYENSAGETENNPMTKVELPPAQAKLFALLHGHFADQESVAGGYSETSPGNWEPSSPHAFSEKPVTTWADKINAAGPEAKALLAKLEPIIGPAVEAVNKKWQEKLVNPSGFMGQSSTEAQVEGHTWAGKTDAEKAAWHEKNQAEWGKLVDKAKKDGNWEDQTKTPAFKKWFGDWEDPKAFSSRRDPAKAPVSMAVKDHKPMVLYHATTGDFSEFDPTKKGVTGFGWLGQFETQRHGFFATPNPEFAHNFIEHKDGTGHNIMPLYMNLKSPMDLTKGTDDIADELKEHGVNPSWVRNVRDQWELFDGEDGKAFVAAAKKAGYDGAIIYESGTKGETQAAYIAFDKNQIKSAIGNNGKFDATNPDIRFSPGEPVTISHPAELSRPAMTKWLLENKAYDSAGPLDAKAARWIASKGKTWTLTTLPTDYFESNEGITDKSHAALSQPIVAHATKDGWEVLDGQHRVKEALDNGVDKIPAYIPAEDKDQSFSPPVKTPTELELQSASSSPEHVKEAIKHAEPGAPIALGTFSPPVMADKTFQELAGKKMLFVIGDQSNAGPHYTTAGGKKVVRMQGGPGYPNIPENQGKAGWAFASKALSTRLAKAFKNVDYMAVFVGSPDMVAGAPSFSKAYFAELKEAVEAGDVKPKALDRLAREIGRSLRKEGGERHSAGPVPVIHNFSELEHLCLGYKPIQQVLFGGEVPVTLASFVARSEIVRKLGSHANSEKFGTPSYEAIRDKFNDTGAFEQGQLAQIIRLHPDKPIGTSEEHGVANHPDYPYVIPGTGLGQPGKKLMLNDVLKPWLEAPLAAAQGGNPDYKVRMNMPQSTINPTAFEK